METIYPITLPSREQVHVPGEAIRALTTTPGLRKNAKPKFDWTGDGVVLHAKFRNGLLFGWVDVLAEKGQQTILVGRLDPTVLSYTEADVVALYGEVVAAAALDQPIGVGELGEAVLASTTPATKDQLYGLIEAHEKLHRSLAKAEPTMEMIKRFGSARLDLDRVISLEPDDTARAMINAKRMWPTATCRGAMYRLCGKSPEFDQAWDVISQQRGIFELSQVLDHSGERLALAEKRVTAAPLTLRQGGARLALAANEMAAASSMRMLRELCADPISVAAQLRDNPAALPGAYSLCLVLDATTLRATPEADGLHTMGVDEIEQDLELDYTAAAVKIFHAVLADIDAGVTIDPEKVYPLLRCSPPTLKILLMKVSMLHEECAGVLEAFARLGALRDAE